MPSYIDLKEEIESKGLSIIEIEGNSMLPLFKSGDSVVVFKIKDSLKVFDVVLYRTNDGRMVIHRIVSIDKEKFILKGDNTLNSETINRNNIFGIIKAYYKNNKYYDLTDSYNKRCYKISKMLVLLKRIRKMIVK